MSYWLDSNRNRYVANPNASAAADQPLVPQDPSAAVVTAFGQMNATLSTVVSECGVTHGSTWQVL